jgi:hypothetical protein
VASPLALARWHHLSAEAEICDVFLQTVGAGIGPGQARLLVQLEFPADEDHQHDSWCSLGGNLADERLRPIADAVLPLDEAQARAQRLIPDAAGRRRTCRVFFPAGHPEDAVMVSPELETSLGAYDVGLALVACGMLTFMLARRLPRTQA